jgi:regulator of sirC expression with transglutaminase-like and TPR domain
MDTARALAEIVRAPEPEIDLTRGALCIARIEHPHLAADPVVAELDALAARSGAAGLGDALRILHRLREFLFAEEGFRGNADDYYDPRNSCLNDVLERRLGIPITLGLVVMEVGARVGLRIQGIGLPGHFVVGAEVDTDSVLLDPFNGGAVLTRDGAHRVVARAVGRPVKLTEETFRPCSRRQILTRMLANLKAVYVSRRDRVPARRGGRGSRSPARPRVGAGEARTVPARAGRLGALPRGEPGGPRRRGRAPATPAGPRGPGCAELKETP